VAIRRSAAADIQHLIDDLCGADDVARQTAAARLSVIGTRAVPHLLTAFARCPSAVGRAAVVGVLEATRDRRGVDLAVAQLDAVTAEPQVQAAAIALLGAHLEGADAGRALEALSALLLDTRRQDLLRLRAIDVLARAWPDDLAPLRMRLADDPNGAVRRWAAGTAATRPTVEPRVAFEAILAGESADPAVLRDLVAEGGQDTALSTLHRLVELVKTREDAARAAADRLEWRDVRGALHAALAQRGSRVALYDVREAFAAATGPLPDGFVESAALVGDAACLEAIADALAREPGGVAKRDEAWRDSLVRAGRAIVRRERLTRRHAAVRKMIKDRPEVAAVLLSS
jgi:hypothetical protein